MMTSESISKYEGNITNGSIAIIPELCVKCKAPLPQDAVFCPLCGKKQIQEQRKTRKRANGTGTVYKLSGRRRRPWVAAKNKVIIGYYEKRTEALEALEQVSGVNVTVRYNLTFAQVFERWKKEHYRNISKVQADLYDRAFTVYEPLHNRKFRDLRTADFQAIIDQHLDMSGSTLTKYKALASQLSQWAIREELITTNFASYVQLPKEEKKEKEIFSDTEIRKLEEDNCEAAKIVLMLIYTGMRIGELFALPLADYHETYCVGGEKTEAGRNRIIPIRPEGRGYFKYFAEQATGELLLSGYVGQHSVNNFRRRDYYPLLKRLEIERKTPHSTRHTYASWAVRQGMQPELLQKILGHADYSTTAEIYVHSDAEQLIHAVESC